MVQRGHDVHQPDIQGRESTVAGSQGRCPAADVAGGSHRPDRYPKPRARDTHCFTTYFVDFLRAHEALRVDVTTADPPVLARKHERSRGILDAHDFRLVAGDVEGKSSAHRGCE